MTNKFNPDIHHRQSIRLKGYDYSVDGAYFVTICAWQRQCLFGEIVEGEMRLNELGRIVIEEWARTAEIRREIKTDMLVVMPNHIHGIVFINGDEVPVGATGRSPIGSTALFACQLPETKRATGRSPLHGSRARSLGAFVGGLKSAITTRVNRLRHNPGMPVRQRNFYERVIRNEDELARAREYIVNNPMKWDMDQENPAKYPPRYHPER